MALCTEKNRAAIPSLRTETAPGASALVDEDSGRFTRRAQHNPPALIDPIQEARNGAFSNSSYNSSNHPTNETSSNNNNMLDPLALGLPEEFMPQAMPSQPNIPPRPTRPGAFRGSGPTQLERVASLPNAGKHLLGRAGNTISREDSTLYDFSSSTNMDGASTTTQSTETSPPLMTTSSPLMTTAPAPIMYHQPMPAQYNTATTTTTTTNNNSRTTSSNPNTGGNNNNVFQQYWAMQYMGSGEFPNPDQSEEFPATDYPSSRDSLRSKELLAEKPKKKHKNLLKRGWKKLWGSKTRQTAE